MCSHACIYARARVSASARVFGRMHITQSTLMCACGHVRVGICTITCILYSCVFELGRYCQCVCAFVAGHPFDVYRQLTRACVVRVVCYVLCGCPPNTCTCSICHSSTGRPSTCACVSRIATSSGQSSKMAALTPTSLT